MKDRPRIKLLLPSLLLTGIVCYSPVFPSAIQKAHRGDVVHLEKVEWTWSDRSDPIDPALPNVLLLGDSITRAYFPETVKKLAGKANVYLFATSCSAGDPRLARQLQDYFQDEPAFTVVHFNNGMHGWAYSDAQFAAALPAMVRTIRKAQPKSRLIWATITPIRRDDPSGASDARIDARNAATLRIMSHEGIAIDDQHGLMAGHGDLHSDDVHYNEEGSRLQGDQAVRSIQQD